MALLAPGPASALQGRLWTPGPVFLTGGEFLTFKLQNLFRNPFAVSVGVLGGNGAMAFQQFLTIPPLAIKDVVAQVNNCTPCTPFVFLGDGQFGPSHARLPLNLDLFTSNGASNSPIKQYPGSSWEGFRGVTLGPTSLDFGSSPWSVDGCKSKTPGAVRLALGFAYFVAFNYGKDPVTTQTGCLDQIGQPQAACEKATIIPPLNATMIQVNGPAELLPFINASPGTLAVNFAVPQFGGGADFFLGWQLRMTPLIAQILNNFDCSHAPE